MLGLAVDEGTALVLQGDRLEMLGGANVQVFIKALGNSPIVWHTLGPGSKAATKRDRQRQATLRRETPGQ